MKTSRLLNKIVNLLRFHGGLEFLPDEQFLKLVFYIRFGKKLNLKDPQTFNEKLQWLKLYYRNPLYSKLVDKYEVKEYVSNVLGKEYIIPTLKVWNDVNDINFEELPDKFVLKCTHDCHSVLICKDKELFDTEVAKKQLNRFMKRSYYKTGREWPYKSVEHRIIAEKYMEDETGELQDYKVHCFNGIPQFILVCSNRFGADGLKEDFYTTEWELMDLKRFNPQSSVARKRPEQLDKMLELSRVLAKDFPFARTDFYIINGQLYFGEITFFPASGFKAFVPEEWDDKLGKLLELPEPILYK